MSWNYKIAVGRINGLIETTPQIKVANFTDNYLPEFEERAARTLAEGLDFKDKPLFNLSSSQGVTVDGVHIYANLVNFNDYLTWHGDESEAAHERALNFLHLHYSSCDRVVENCGAQRVDFHGGRMHAVIIEPAGDQNAGVRVAKAIVLAEQLSQLSEGFSSALRGDDYGADYRFGIDTGICIAINSGRGFEPEPLFLGSAANHAAKLADGDASGTYLSDRAQAALANTGVQTVGNIFDRNIDERPVYRLSEANIPFVVQRGSEGVRTTNDLLEQWVTETRAGTSDVNVQTASFEFHQHTLPLRTITYKDLMPSNSVRMDMASVFADLDGYTSYIDSAMNDKPRLANAIHNLHVIRGELANVLQKDFDGRKVRFIGDCIHGLVASGSKGSVDEAQTVRTAILCAGGMRSSFDLCTTQLSDADQLGLAIGIELGTTPVTRLGIRGERSVRVASSSSTIMSEDEQKRSDGYQTAIGARAFQEGSQSVKSLFGPTESRRTSTTMTLFRACQQRFLRLQTQLLATRATSERIVRIDPLRPLHWVRTNLPSWTQVINSSQMRLEVSAAPPKSSGIKCLTTNLRVWESNGRLGVSELQPGTRFPAACPERHVNRDGSFCVGLNSGANVNSAGSAEKWWNHVAEYLCCQEYAEKNRRWPPGKGLSHGEPAAEAQLIAENAARKLGLLQQYRDAVDFGVGWLAGTFPRVSTHANRLVNGRAACPKGCVKKCGAPILRRKCRKRSETATLISAENCRRKAEHDFIESFRTNGFVCCERMLNCPFSCEE